MGNDKTNPESYTILIVDDDTIILNLLNAELKEDFSVKTASGAEEAFDIIESGDIDLVISDINMPGIKGYDLIKGINRKFPEIKTALITAYNIDDYIKYAKDYGITNIIPKSTPFNTEELKSIVHSLLFENHFGLANYMLPEYEVIASYSIKRSDEIGDVEASIIENLSQFIRKGNNLNMLLEELITNAVYHAPMDERGKEKYKKHSEVILSEDEWVQIEVGKDSEKYGVSVMDNSGKLSKERILYSLDRHISGNGLLDEHGRGIHMSRIYSDRLLYNIKRDEFTEAIFINYINRKYKGSKPLYINEC